MNVKCIDNKGWYLTIGKIYEVIDEDTNNCYYNIINDKGGKFWYSKNCFKTLFEIRKEKINKLLE